MNIYLAYGSMADHDIKTQALQNRPEEAKRYTNDVERANRIMESWLLAHGGILTGYQDGIGMAAIDPQFLTELPKVREQYEEAVNGAIARIGIGKDLREALNAYKVAQTRSGDRAIVLWTPDLTDELSDPKLSPDDSEQKREEFEEETPINFDTPTPRDGLSKSEAMLLEKAAGFGAEPPAGEATKITQGKGDPMGAQPSAPASMSGPPSFSAPSADQGQPGQQPAAQGQPQDDSEAIKKAVIQALKDIRAQTPLFEKLKEVKPEAYEAVMGLVEIMLKLAKKFVQTQNGVVQKSEEDFGEPLAKGYKTKEEIPVGAPCGIPGCGAPWHPSSGGIHAAGTSGFVPFCANCEKEAVKYIMQNNARQFRVGAKGTPARQAQGDFR